jgi:hypothetical protein
MGNTILVYDDLEVYLAAPSYCHDCHDPVMSIGSYTILQHRSKQHSPGLAGGTYRQSVRPLQPVQPRAIGSTVPLISPWVLSYDPCWQGWRWAGAVWGEAVIRKVKGIDAEKDRGKEKDGQCVFGHHSLVAHVANCDLPSFSPFLFSSLRA